MTKQDELDALRKQRSELDRKIKALQNCVITSERCRFFRKHYGTCRKDEWIVSYRSRIFAYPNEDKHRTLIATPNRQQAIDEIDKVIKDLETLKQRIGEEEYAE